MNAVLLLVVSFAGYIIAYNTYGKFLAKKIFKLKPSANVPSKTKMDNVDFVPTKKSILFGHHFTSIAGTGPIVGPAIGIIWGWVPAILWIFLGSIFMGAVHDFTSLVISMRNEGKSLSDITAKYINNRVRLIFFIIIFFELLIVIAIFGLIIAIIFALFPHSVLPVWLQIPIAVALGYFIYKRKQNVLVFTVIAVGLMYFTMLLGHMFPLKLDSLWGIPATGLWSILLLIYVYFASTLPVTTLLQPRDYINAWQLIVAMGIMVIGIFVSGLTGNLEIVAPAFNLNATGAPPVWPFLFITIACGAISGFHALVSSGTSSKQISNETDAQFIGYGSMLLEALLATIIIIAVSAGIGIAYELKSGEVLTGITAWNNHYISWGASSGLASKIDAVVIGIANMLTFIGIPKTFGVVIMGVFVASFAGTTLDSATRIQRYIISEMFSKTKIVPVKKAAANKWLATFFAVITAGVLAFGAGADGKGALSLWPLFGALNQLLAALALMVGTIYLKKKYNNNSYILTALPFVFMLIMTSWAMISNEINFISDSNILLSVLNGCIILLTLWMVHDTLHVFLTKKVK